MNQTEMQEFFGWCEDTLKGFEVQEAEESKHFYLNDELVGGLAGDRNEYFIKHNDDLASAIRMFDASRPQRVFNPENEFNSDEYSMEELNEMQELNEMEQDGLPVPRRRRPGR